MISIYNLSLIVVHYDEGVIDFIFILS